ncbi:MAG: c-type cytochrome [Dongiaceae bacterium]
MNLVGRLAVGALVTIAAGFFLFNMTKGSADAASQAEPAAGIQIAELTPAESIVKRQELMKQLGGHMKAVKAFLESNEGNSADVATHAQAIQTASGQIVELFPVGTSLDDNVAKTAAKPAIWEKSDDFKASADTLGVEAGKLVEVAATGDAIAIGDQFGSLGKNGCGGCHSEFRQKTE